MGGGGGRRQRSSGLVVRNSKGAEGDAYDVMRGRRGEDCDGGKKMGEEKCGI
jgi:hypothetical protein